MNYSPLQFAEIIMALCFAHHGSVSSWGRTDLHNASVGGEPESRHRLWLGMDVILDGMLTTLPQDRSSDITQNISKFMSDCRRYDLIVLDEGDHIHVQTQ